MTIHEFNDLPQPIKDLLPFVAGDISGVVIGNTDQGATDPRLQRIAQTALILAHRYAPSSPIEIMREAATRCAGYLAGTRPHVSRQNIASPSGTGIELEFLTARGGTGALRASGGMSLLSGWKIRRAGVIG